jgi:homoserine kinase
MIIRVPASTANLGPGFDALGCALGLYAHLRLDPDPSGRAPVDEHHAACQAFRSAGGTGPLWVSSQIPMGRGLGSSAALRVGGVVAAVVQHHGPDVDVRDPRFHILSTATAL